MSIKNIFDKFFYLEEVEEEYAPTQTQTQQAKNTSPKLVQNELQQNFQRSSSKTATTTHSKSNEKGA